jgi:membrane fusion protein (multidrug efflux system)
MTRTIELTGTVEAARVARIASPAEGPVLNCAIREGDRVEEGQVILALGRKRAAEELAAAARQELAREEEDLERIEQLVRSGAIPAEQRDEGKLLVARARAKLSQALEGMEDYQIRAPWNGVVSKVMVTDGYFVSPRETLVEIFDPENLVLQFAVPEKDSQKVHPGMKLTVTLDAYENRVFRAKITRVFPELDRKMRARIIEAALDEEVALVPGMFARVAVPVQTLHEAIVVPDAAIVITPQGERLVFIIEDGKAVARTVTLGIEQERTIQITSGIESGDSVVVSGNQKLQHNMAVRILGSNN